MARKPSHVERLVADGARVTDEDFRRSELPKRVEQNLINQMIADGWTTGRTKYPEQNEFWPPSEDYHEPNRQQRTTKRGAAAAHDLQE